MGRQDDAALGLGLAEVGDEHPLHLPSPSYETLGVGRGCAVGHGDGRDGNQQKRQSGHFRAGPGVTRYGGAGMRSGGNHLWDGCE